MSALNNSILKKFILLLFVLLCGFVRNGIPGNNDDLFEIYYDDGNPNLTLQFMENSGIFFVTRFTPPSVPVQLIKLKYYMANTTGGKTADFSILPDVYGEPYDGKELFGPISISGARIGWNEYDLSDQNIFVSDDFYYVLRYDNVSKFSIGAENREPFSGRTWDSDC